MSVTMDCTEACEKVAVCSVCHRKKPPIGRDVAAAMSGSYCERECLGYHKEPRSGHLWPGELERSKSAREQL